MGEVFAGRYELIDLIGEGGMGTIWVALDRKTNGLVAAKVLRQSDAGTLVALSSGSSRCVSTTPTSSDPARVGR
jgi:serine/threonine protein kinase